MKTVWKFPLQGKEVDVISMPQGAQVLCVQPQGPEDQLHLWALVDPKALYEARTFRVIGTGWEIDPALHLKYISTVKSGWLVFHVFEELPA